MSSVDDQIRSALDRVRVSLTGQLEAELAASASDIRRVFSAAQSRSAAEAAERAAADVRREAEGQLVTVQEEFDRRRRQLQEETAIEIGALQQTVAAVREELLTAQRQLEDARQERETVRRQLAESRHETDEARGEIEETRRELESARGEVARAERYAAGLHSLDEATSLVEVLDGLARLARQETERAAIFLVDTDRLRAWRAIGFEPMESIVGGDLGLEQSGVIGEAARSGRGRQYPNGNGSTLPTFAGGSPSRRALAVPVEVGGSVVAVLYADAPNADTPEEPRWPEIVEGMTRHAGRVLEAMTVRHAAALRAAPISSQSRQHVASPGRGTG